MAGGDMASLQAICSICEKTVTAFTLIGDSELELVLERDEPIMVRHFFGDGSGKSLDHRWTGRQRERESREAHQIDGAREEETWPSALGSRGDLGQRPRQSESGPWRQENFWLSYFAGGRMRDSVEE
jgi:hypothetical protein